MLTQRFLINTSLKCFSKIGSLCSQFNIIETYILRKHLKGTFNNICVKEEMKVAKVTRVNIGCKDNNGKCVSLY